MFFGDASLVASPRQGNLRQQRKAFLRHIAVIIEEVVAPRSSTGLQMQQMFQRLVDVEGRDEAAGVELRVDEQLGKLLFEPFGQQEEEERQAVFQLTDVSVNKV